MKKILWILVLGLILNSCAPKSAYKMDTSSGGTIVLVPDIPRERAVEKANYECKRYGKKATNINLAYQGSYLKLEDNLWHYDCEKVLTAQEKELKKKLEEEKRIAEANKKKEKEKRLMVELENNYGKECEGSLLKKGFKKGSKEYNNCLLNNKADLEKKQKELAKKLAAMTPKERHAYNCSETFKFRKGTEKFNDCVFKLYTAELDLQKLELEKKVAEAQIKAAATEQARAEAVANAQIAAAKSAKRSSDLNNSIQLMKLGSSMLGGSTSSSSSSNSFDINNRTRTTCRVVGGFLNCY